MEWLFRTMIVPAALVELARDACITLTGGASELIFTTAVSPDGIEPTTHYISSGMISKEFADVLHLLVDGIEYVSANMPAIMYMLSEAGSTATQADIEGLLSQLYISEEGATCCVI